MLSLLPNLAPLNRPRFKATASLGYAATVLADSPLGFWRLSETTGSTAFDSSPNGRNGGYFGGHTKGVSGATTDGNKAVFLDGGSGVLGLLSGGFLNGKSSASVELWMAGGSTANNYPTLAGWNMSGGSQHGLRILQAPSGGGNFIFCEVFGNGGSSGSSLTAGVGLNGAFHHIVAVANGATGVVSITIDAATTISTSASWGTFTNNPDAIAGRRYDGTNYSFLACTVDEIAFYDYALTPAQITNHFNAR